MSWYRLIACLIAFLSTVDLCLAGSTDDPSKKAMLSGSEVSAWLDSRNQSSRAADFLAAVNSHKVEGFDLEQYNYSYLVKSLREPGLDVERLKSTLTQSFLRFVGDITRGRILPSTLGFGWDSSVEEILPVEILVRFFSDEAFDFDSLEPQHPSFKRLYAELLRHQSMRVNGGWERLSLNATPEKIADRLLLSGDLSSSELPRLSEPNVIKDAVVRFQQRHGLESDGILGNKTLAALNVPLEARISQIQLNLERWRWLPRNLEDVYVEVNIPEYQLRVYERGAVVLQMRAIVGRPPQRTPVTRSEIISLEVNPNWNVPRSIATREILPLLKKDAKYLLRHHMVLLKQDGSPVATPKDWSSYDRNNFPFRLRQLPGTWNSVGPIKFIFPNRYGVFLHGTPAMELFNSVCRGFSHGCIRVEDPLSLADYVNSGDFSKQALVKEALQSGDTKVVRLPRTVPIYLNYWTAWVDEEGKMHFADDVYGGDRLLSKALKYRYQRAE